MNWLLDLNLWQSIVLFATMLIMIWQGVLQRREYKIEAYRRVGQDYLDFLRICFRHPELDLIDVDDDKLSKMTQEIKQKLAAYSFLFNSWEHAFLLHKDGLMPVSQWTGWDRWIKWFLTQKLSCREAWKLVGQTYDEDFEDYISKALKTMQETRQASNNGSD